MDHFEELLAQFASIRDFHRPPPEASPIGEAQKIEESVREELNRWPSRPVRNPRDHSVTPATDRIGVAHFHSLVGALADSHEAGPTDATGEELARVEEFNVDRRGRCPVGRCEAPFRLITGPTGVRGCTSSSSSVCQFAEDAPGV